MIRTLFRAGYAATLTAMLAVPVHAQGSEVLVTSSWLSQHLRDRNLVIVQVGPKEDYDKEHVAGARFIQLSDISTPFKEGTLNLEMPAPDTLRRHLEALGISDASQVVVVFTSEWVSPATRVVFTLNYAGLGDRAKLLDGGLPAWKRAGYAVTADAPRVTPGHIAAPQNPSLIVDNAFVQAHQSAAHFKIIDARAPQFYAGPPIKGTGGRGDSPAGHIAGAMNIPFTTLFDDSAIVLTRTMLAEKFREAGVQKGDTVIAYCHVGQQATVVVLSARLLGIPVRLYDGSMQDWQMRKLPLEGGKP